MVNLNVYNWIGELAIEKFYSVETIYFKSILEN